MNAPVLNYPTIDPEAFWRTSTIDERHVAFEMRGHLQHSVVDFDFMTRPVKRKHLHENEEAASAYVDGSSGNFDCSGDGVAKEGDNIQERSAKKHA
jgi:hypothetical protein